jgi:hypothetical protein
MECNQELKIVERKFAGKSRMVEIKIKLICDHTECRKAATLYRLREGESGKWHVIGQFDRIASKDGMVHACSDRHADLIDASTRERSQSAS